MQKFLLIAPLLSLISFNFVNSFPKVEYQSPSSNSDDRDPYNMPESCTKRYCTIKDDDYPLDDVNKLVLNISKLNKDIKLSYNNIEIPSIQYSDFSDVEPDCKAVHGTVPIYYIKDQKDKTRVVVQSGSGLFNQTFEIRECPHEGPVSESKVFLNTSRVRVSCETTYLLFDFYVLGEGKDIEMEVIQAELPVCCKCTYKNAW